jgi:tRNA U38,U39,U40 pseudouridine synthase TruA
MVRRIVAALLAVGTGKLEVAAVGRLLEAREPALDGAAAPAKGLCLRRVALGRRDDGPRAGQDTAQEHETGHEE